MISGIGIDIIEVKRIRNAIKRWGDHFINYVFTKEEIEYSQKFQDPNPHFAARFAAKEAVFKALQDQDNIRWHDIKILHNEKGRPICHFRGKDFSDKILISISHIKDYAVANAIISK